MQLILFELTRESEHQHSYIFPIIRSIHHGLALPRTGPHTLAWTVISLRQRPHTITHAFTTASNHFTSLRLRIKNTEPNTNRSRQQT